MTDYESYKNALKNGLDGLIGEFVENRNTIHFGHEDVPKVTQDDIKKWTIELLEADKNTTKP